MKSPITWLPTLLLCGAIFAVASSAPATSSSGQSSFKGNEAQQLRQDLKKISDRLEQLDSASHHIVPRGVSSTTTFSTSTPLGAA